MVWVDIYYHGVPSNVQCSPGIVCDADYEAVRLTLPENLANKWEWTKFVTLGRSRDFDRNAYAVMRGSERYIVFGTGVNWGGDFFGENEFLLTFGHELGHHVYGHTADPSTRSVACG
jgi:hypothetical protein